MAEEKLTVKQVAAHYEVRRSVILKRAKRLGLGILKKSRHPDKNENGTWFFTVEEVKLLAPGKSGNFGRRK